MKFSKLMTVIVICAIVILGFTGATYVVFKIDQKENLQFEALQQAELRYDEAQNEKLEYELEQNEKIKYELMFNTIKENSDLYENFSNKFLSDFEKSIYAENCPLEFSFPLYDLYDRLDNEFDNYLLGDECYIKQFREFRFVELLYPRVIKIYKYSPNSTTNYDYQGYMIIYIPDEYMDEESLNTISVDFYYSNLTNVIDNLFIVECPDYV
jgi:hypothetical protein